MKYRAVLAALASMVLINGAFAGNGIVVSDAWVREGPPNASALAGFMTIHNHSNKTHSLVKASSGSFATVEVHRTMKHDGMMKMMHQEKVEIPAKGSLEFKPGDHHIMMMKPKKAYLAGDHVMVTLSFADGTKIKVKYPVRKGQGKKMDHGHDDMRHDQHKMEH